MSQDYEKINWKNRIDTGNKYKITNNSDETKTIKYAGEVKQAGTPINADNLNHMDEGIYQNNQDIKNIDEKKLNKNSPDYVSVKYFFKTSDLNTDFMLSSDDPNKVIFCCYNNAITLNNSPKLLTTPCQIIMERIFNGTSDVPDTIEQTFIGLINGGASDYSICTKYHRLYRGSNNTNTEWTEWKEINTDIGRDISDISGLTESLKNKVDNTNSGAVDLLEKIQETETLNIQTSNNIIIQDLKNYIKVPITKLWDWIKGQVATTKSAGVMSAEDKIKLDGIDNGANKITVDNDISTTSKNPLQNKIITSKLNDKVDNTADGAGILIGKLYESNIEPGDEDDIIIQNLNSYTRRPLTALWSWIKKNTDKEYLSSSGTATTAIALTSKNVGSNVVPTYFDANGKPAVCKYTLGDASTKTIKTLNVISHTGWTNQTTDQNYVPDMAFMAWWNGAYNADGNSSLTYCNKGKFDTAATKDVDTTVTSNSTNLITSGGVYSKLYQYRPMVVLPGTSGSTGYVCFAELKVAGNYVNAPIEFKISSRGRFICNVTVRFASKGNTDPDIETLSFCGQDYKIYAYKSATSTWQLYALKSESYDSITVLATYRPGQFNGTITYPGTLAATKHTGTTTNPVVDSTWGYKVGTANNATTVNNHTVNADVPSDAKFTDTTYSSLKNPYSITIQGNGTTLTNGTYDGSVAKTVNITPANIGACTATDGIVNNSFKVTKSSGATLTITAAADKITISTDKKLFIGDDSGFASSTKIYGTFDHAQTVLYSSTSSSTLTSVSIANLFTEYSLIWINIQGSKTSHSHVVPLKYLKSKGSIIFKDAGSSAIVPLNLLYVSDTEMRWFEYQAQGQGAETYTSVQIVKIY